MGDCGPNPPAREVTKEESIAHGIVKRFEQLETQVRFILPVATIIPGKVVCISITFLSLRESVYVYLRHSHVH